MQGKPPETFLPLSTTSFFILASLIAGPKHGYAIAKDVKQRSAGEVEIAVGNLYVALKRLLEDELIERVAESEASGDRRKTYGITDLGRRVVELEIARIERLARTASALLPAFQGG